MPAALAIGVVVALWFLFGARVSAAISRPAAPSDAIGAFAQAIASAEGFGDPGAVPTRANNPGDLALGGNTLGAGITIYATPADGWNALYSQLARIRDGQSAYYRTDMSIADMGAIYAPGEGAAWAANVAAALGVSVNTTIGSLLS